MLPLRLTLEGIYSYQERQTIDFKRLTESQLFGIFGHVGSGKSTILEAISLALYGVSERLSKQDSPNYNLMNLRSSGLFIDFEFEAGAARDRYRFTVKAKRQQKHFEKVNPLERHQYQWLNGEWSPISANDATPILGLSYQYFRRTIIIPQGRFQEFLQLKDSDRTQMMQDLFDLHRFDLQAQVKSLKNQTGENLQHVEGQLVGYQHVSSKALVTTWENCHTIQADLGCLRHREHHLRAQYQHQQQLKEQHEQYQQALKHFNQLAGQKLAYDQWAETLRQLRNCRNSFKDRLDQSKRLEHSLQQHYQNLDQTLVDIKALKEQYQQQKAEWDKLTQKFVDLPTFREYIRDLRTIFQIRQHEESLAENHKAQAQAQEAVEKANEAFETQEAECQRIRENLQAYHQHMPDQATLSAVKNWFTQNNSIKNQKESVKQDLKQKKEAIDALKNQYETLIQEHQLASLNPDFASYSFKALRQALHELKTQYQTKLDDIDQALLKLRTQEAFESHAANLQPGEPCPVCGAIDHPNPLKIGDTQSALTTKQQEREAYKAWITTMEQALQGLEGLKSQYHQLVKEQEQLEKRLREWEQQLTDHLENFVWEAYREMDETQVDEALKNANAQQAALQNLEQQRNNAEEAKEKARAKSQEAAQKLQDLRQSGSQYQERINANKEQVIHLTSTQYEAYDKDSLQQTLDDWQARYEQMQTLDEKLEQLKENINNQELKANQIRTQITEQKRSLDDLNQTIDHLLAQSSFDNLGEVQALLDQYQNLDVDAEENELNDFYRRYEAQRGIVEDYQAKIEQSEPFDEAVYTSLKQRLETTAEARRTAEEQLAVQRDTLKRLQKALYEKRDLEARQEALKSRHSNLEVLEKLFRGRGFVRYISSVFLEELVRAANERFRHLTHNQLQLEVTGTANLEIRDLLNDGQLRSVKTLSGGQTFQVSLSLALALAERIQKLTQSHQNFFFLDEGFGSLDRQSLNLVFHTLYRLRTENRIVGLISHVEELKEGIETALTVENHPERGSLIRQEG